MSEKLTDERLKYYRGSVHCNCMLTPSEGADLLDEIDRLRVDNAELRGHAEMVSSLPKVKEER